MSKIYWLKSYKCTLCKFPNYIKSLVFEGYNQNFNLNFRKMYNKHTARLSSDQMKDRVTLLCMKKEKSFDLRNQFKYVHEKDDTADEHFEKQLPESEIDRANSYMNDASPLPPMQAENEPSESYWAHGQRHLRDLDVTCLERTWITFTLNTHPVNSLFLFGHGTLFGYRQNFNLNMRMLGYLYFR